MPRQATLRGFLEGEKSALGFVLGRNVPSGTPLPAALPSLLFAPQNTQTSPDGALVPRAER